MPYFLRPFLVPFRFGGILRQLLRREILGRYRGSLLGVGWSFVTPILMLAVYTFVFVGVFSARWPGAETEGGLAYSLRLFAGLTVFNFFAEVLGRSPHLVVEQPNLVKKVAFPLEALPFVALGAGLFHFLLSMAVLLVGTLIVHQHLPWSVLLMPLVLLPLALLLLGLSWLLAALGVFLRDIAQLTGLVISLLMFLSPIFYSVQSLAPGFRFWIGFNPLTQVIENLRSIIFAGVVPNWPGWIMSLALAAAVAVAGAAVFQATRREFSDVL